RMRERIEALRFEAETAGMTAEAIAYLEAVRRLDAAATADGTELSREEARANRELAATYATATAAKARSAEEARDLAAADREAERRADELTRSLDQMGQTVGNSLGGLIAQTNSWRDALSQVLDVALRIAQTQLEKSGFLGNAGSAISSGVGGFLQSVFGGLFADGAAFRHGRVVPFAGGGIVSQPTHFPMAGGRIGLMGERGHEAIM